MGDNSNNVEIALPGEWALKKAFGPVLGELGEDLKSLYAKGRDKILAVGYKKITDINDGKQANLRVARDVFWNGSFSDEAICAEYFGGILASSRSEDGRDDNGVHYTDTIKSLSSKQLHLHYIVYNSLNKYLASMEEAINVALSYDLGKYQIFFSLIELQEYLGLKNIDSDLNILYKQGLFTEYHTQVHRIDEKKAVPYVKVKPTTFGVLLYAIAHNKFEARRSFSSNDFGNFDDIILPRYYAGTIEELSNKIGI